PCSGTQAKASKGGRPHYTGLCVADSRCNGGGGGDDIGGFYPILCKRSLSTPGALSLCAALARFAYLHRRHKHVIEEPTTGGQYAGACRASGLAGLSQFRWPAAGHFRSLERISKPRPNQ